MPPLGQCPICFEPLGRPIFHWQCGHSAHVGCLDGRWPLPCPVCRHAWDGSQDTDRIMSLIALQPALAVPMSWQRNDWSAPSPEQVVPQAPRYVIPTCCPRLLRVDNEWVPSADRRMQFAPDNRHQGPAANMWMCFSCGREVRELDIPNLEEWGGAPYCMYHDSDRSLWVDFSNLQCFWACTRGELNDVPVIDDRCAPAVICMGTEGPPGSYGDPLVGLRHALRDLLRASSPRPPARVIDVADSEDEAMVGDDGRGDAGDEVADADEAHGSASEEFDDDHLHHEAVQDELHALALIAERAEVIEELAELDEIVARADDIGP